METLIFVDGDQTSPEKIKQLIEKHFKKDKIYGYVCVSSKERYLSQCPKYFELGFYTESVPPTKDSADIHLILKANEMFNMAVNIKKIVIVSNDHIFAHLFNYISKTNYKNVSFIAAISGKQENASTMIKQSAHHVVYI